jgi:hypothetical protein
MTGGRSLIFLKTGMMVMILICAMTAAVDGMGTKPPQSVPYRKMRMADYQNFIRNWDEKKDPLLYALVSTPAEYRALFHPAPTMPSSRPFAPNESLYEKEQILVAARVMPHPKNVDEVFEIEKIIEKRGSLSLYYKFNNPEPAAEWQGKIYLAVRIPRRSYQKIFFFENGKPVGELNTAAGQWSVPALEPARGKTGD